MWRRFILHTETFSKSHPTGIQAPTSGNWRETNKTPSNLSNSSISIYLKPKTQSYFFMVVVKFAASLLEKFMSPAAWYQPQVSLQMYQEEDKQHPAADGLKRKTVQQLVKLKAVGMQLFGSENRRCSGFVA